MSSTAPVSGPPFITVSFGQATLKGEDIPFIYQPGRQPHAEPGTLPWNLFAICDGHQGAGAAIFVQAHLWKLLEKRLPTSFPSQWEGEELQAFADKIRKALVDAVDEVDTEWYNEEKPSGTTLTVVLVSGWLLSVANVGDTFAILHTGDTVMEMTRSHRLDDCADERRRLSDSGAHLAALGPLLQGPAPPGERGLGPLRVWPGGLAVGRSIGDTDVSPYVLPLPHVRQMVLPAAGSRLLVASDGLWDFMPNRKIYNVCRTKSLRRCASHLVRMVGRAGGGEFKDDLTVIVVDLLPKPQQDFKSVVAERRKGAARYPAFAWFCVGPVTVEDPKGLLSDVDGLKSRPDGTVRRKRTIKFAPDNIPSTFPKTVDYSVHGADTGGARHGDGHGHGEKSLSGGLSRKVIKVFSTVTPHPAAENGNPNARKPPLGRRRKPEDQQAK